MMRSNGWYGWTPDVPDHRDKLYANKLLKLAAPVIVPPRIDLREEGGLFPVYSQGSLGSCTANALGKAITFDLVKRGHIIDPSRLFIYYNERAIEGTIESDSGAQLRDGIKSIVDWGVCDEVTWPYDISKFTVKPPESAYTSALIHQALAYHRISESLDEMKICLAQGSPFVFGFAVYESFEADAVAATGLMPMPNYTERLLGGHAVLAMGYIDGPETRHVNGQPVVLQNVIVVQNSWGPDWGDNGFFYMPYDYITNPSLADDRWVITQMENDIS